MTPWRLTYAGAPDEWSAQGTVQPSWHRFDKRVWAHPDGRELTLTNLRNVLGRFVVPARKIALYRVEIKDKTGKIIWMNEGAAWQTLVAEAKKLTP